MILICFNAICWQKDHPLNITLLISSWEKLLREKLHITEFLCSYEYHLINIISFLHETYPSSRTSLPILGLPLPLNYFTNSRLTFAYTLTLAYLPLKPAYLFLDYLCFHWLTLFLSDRLPRK